MSYLRNSVAPTTRKSYDGIVAAFRRWRTEGNRSADELPTANELVTWAAELGDRGGLAASSIRGYVAAIGEWYTQLAHPDSQAPNPARAAVLRAVLNGIERAQFTQKKGSGQSARPLLYTTLQALSFEDTPRGRMRRAAAYLGVAGGFRPGELFTSASQRPLRRNQLQFYADAAGTVPLVPPGGGGVARLLEVRLHATKTTQIGGVTKLISAPDAVTACWAWFSETAARGADAVLFQETAEGRPITSYALMQDLSRRMAKAGLGTVRLTGKSLRQGGASTLAVQGRDEADIAALGWATGSSAWQIYARDPQAQRQRAIQLSTQMQAALPPLPQPERVRGAPVAAECR
jgi:hypothetical protein